MRFIQSLWIPERKKESIWAGHDQSADIWKLSNKLLNKHGDVEFFGCPKALVFADETGLRFSKTHELPDSFSQLGEKAWSLPKIYAASRQNDSFLHVDGDVFLYQWSLIDLPDFLVQNEEPFHEDKGKAWFYGLAATLFQNQVPDVARYWNLAQKYTWSIWNFGIFGGSAHKSLSSACKEIFEFSIKNWAKIEKSPNDIFTACVLEQILIPLLLQDMGIRPKEYLRASNLQQDAREKFFCHLIGPTKSYEWVKTRVKERLSSFEKNAF